VNIIKQKRLIYTIFVIALIIIRYF